VISSARRDLDFFGLTANAVDELVPAADRALQAASFTMRHIQESHGFARLIVESGEDRTELDLGTDARLFPVEPGSPAPLLSGEELAVDKVLARTHEPAPGRDSVSSQCQLARCVRKPGLDRTSWTLADAYGSADQG
jgi:hypothetical protein